MYYFISPFYFKVPFSLRDYFDNKKKFTVEIGFGNGDFTIELAKKEVEYGYLGVEISSRSVLKLTRKLLAEGITNVRTIKMNAYLLFSILQPPFSVDRVIYNFPDPWPHDPSRRVSAKKHLLLIHRVLRKDGVFFLSTDSDILKDDIEENATGIFHIEKRSTPYFNIRTKYESRWLFEDKDITYYCLHPIRYEGKYPILDYKGGSSLAHVILRMKEKRKSINLRLPIRKRLENNMVIIIDKPYTRSGEYLYPVLVKEDGFVQKTFFKLYFTHNEARLVISDTSYLVVTRGIRMGMSILKSLLLDSGAFEVKIDTT